MEKFVLFVLGVGFVFMDALAVFGGLAWAHATDSRIPDLGYWTCFALTVTVGMIVRGFSAANAKN